MRVIRAADIVSSIADALQFVSYYHPADFVQALKSAYQKETSAPARNALLQLLYFRLSLKQFVFLGISI